MFQVFVILSLQFREKTLTFSLEISTISILRLKEESPSGWLWVYKILYEISSNYDETFVC